MKRKVFGVLVLLVGFFIYQTDWEQWSSAEHEAFIPSYNNTDTFVVSKTQPRLRLHVERWLVDNPKALVFISHGYGEYIGRYRTTAHTLNEHGYSVFGIDHQGHGLSGGDRAHVAEFHHYSTDFVDFAENEMEKYPDVPRYLLGHSMGSLIAMQSVLLGGQEKWDGMILSSPPLAPPPSLLLSIIEYIAPFAPKMPVYGHTLGFEGLNTDQSEIEKYLNDELVYHGYMRLLWGKNILHAITDIANSSERIQLPLLLIHGDADTICPIEFSRPFFSHIGSADKTFLEYPGLKHELFQEPDKQRVFSDVISWLDAHVATKTTTE